MFLINFKYNHARYEVTFTSKFKEKFIGEMVYNYSKFNIQHAFNVHFCVCFFIECFINCIVSQFLFLLFFFLKNNKIHVTLVGFCWKCLNWKWITWRIYKRGIVLRLNCEKNGENVSYLQSTKNKRDKIIAIITVRRQ